MNEVITNIVPFFVGGGSFVGLFIWCIYNLDKLERIVAWLYRTFSWANKKWEYGRAATEVQATINTAGEEIYKQAPNILPHAMKIEWAKNTQEVEAFLRRGEVIVKMGYSKDRDRNLVVSTLAYVKKGLLPNARPYVDKTLIKAADFTIAKNVFTSTKRDTATTFFLQNCLEPEIAANSQLRDDCILLDQMNKAGFLTRIFLMQIKFLGEKLFPSTPTPVVQRETRSFAEFLIPIATRESGTFQDLDFAKPRIRIKVMLIAREETISRGTALYTRRIKMAQSDGIEYVYICAWGRNNCRWAEQVATEQVRAGRLTILSSNKFTRTFDNDQQAIAICIVCALNLKQAPEDSLGAPGVISSLLEEHVDEVRDGKVAVVAISRQPGILSKIVVKKVENDVDEISCFTKQLQYGQLGTALGNESLHVIRWHDDPIKRIAASLYPLEADEVTSVRVNEEEKIAHVTVRDRAAMKKAIGRKGINVKMANKLTGWYIEIKQRDDMADSNDELLCFTPDD